MQSEVKIKSGYKGTKNIESLGNSTWVPIPAKFEEPEKSMTLSD